MIEIFRDGESVVLTIEHGLGVEIKAMRFDWKCRGELEAAALASCLREHLRQRIEAVRREEYESGHRDGRAKRAKATWFWRTLTSGTGR